MGVRTLIIPLFLVLFCCVFGCKNTRPNPVSENAYDLPQIKDSGELVVLTLYSSTSYIGDRKWDFNTNLAISSPKVWD